MEQAARTAALTPGTTAVKAAPGRLVAAILNRGSADASLIIYDHPSAASGTKLAKLQVTATDPTATWTPASPQLAPAGLTAVLAGTGSTAQVVYH
jgi:hypothetical protein